MELAEKPEEEIIRESKEGSVETKESSPASTDSTSTISFKQVQAYQMSQPMKVNWLDSGGFEWFKERKERVALIEGTPLSRLMDEVNLVITRNALIGVKVSENKENVAMVTEVMQAERDILRATTEEFLEDAVIRIRKRAERLENERHEEEQRNSALHSEDVNDAETLSQPLSVEEKDSREEALKETDAKLARFQAKNSLTAADPVLSNGPHTSFDVDDDAKYGVASSWLARTFPQEIAKEEVLPSPYDSIPTLTDEVHPDEFFTPPAISQEVIDHTGKGVSQEAHEEGESREGGIVPPRFHALESSQKKVERIEESLWERAKEVKNRLTKSGLNSLAGGLEWFSKCPPENKLLLGVVFAGSSLATGGALTALPIALSAGSFATHLYTRSLEALERKGVFVTEALRRKAAVRATLLGLFASVTTAAAMAEVFSLVGEAFHASKDVVPSPSSPEIHAAAPDAQPQFSPAETAPPTEQVTTSQNPVSDESASSAPATPPATPEAAPPVDLVAIGQAEMDRISEIGRRAANMPLRGEIF